MNQKAIILIGCAITILVVAIFYVVRSQKTTVANQANPVSAITPSLSQISQTSSPETSPAPKTTTQKMTSKEASNQAVSWQRREGGVWQAVGTPPACPEPLVMTPPVEISKVTGILVPGQPRGEAWKPHGAFRFQNETNEATIIVPMDAQLIRGSRAFRNGENQYAFDFIAPCGIWFGMGHLLELSPKFLAIANKLPLVEDSPDGTPAKKQYYDIDPPINVTTGEQIATKVGYFKEHNTMVDFTLLDLRHQNGFTLRPEWARFESQFDHYAVCFLDYLPAADRDTLRGLFGSGDSVTGVKSDYCQYPENK